MKRLIEYDDSDNFQIIINFTSSNQIETKNNNNNYNNDSQNSQEKKDKITINTTKNKARVISRKINDSYQVDPTINEYPINLPQQLKSQLTKYTKESIEETLQTLIKSIVDKIEVNKNQQEIYSIITTILNGYTDKEDKMRYEVNSQEEAISLLSTEFHSRSIEYLSGHIKEFILSSEMRNIEEGIIKEIIDAYVSHREDVEKENESEIYDIFESLVSEGEAVTVMHFLLSLGIEEYDESMIKFIYDNLDDEIIECEISGIIFTLRCHFLELLETVKNKKKNRKKKKLDSEEKECEYNGNELSGIIDYLQKQNGADLEAGNILKLSGGGYPCPSCPITNLIKYNSNNMNSEFYYNYYSGTPSSSDGWIEFDFVNKTVNLTSYTIRTSDCFYPKSWRIVGSNDHEHWEDVDHRVNNSELNGDYKQHRFENTKSDKYYRYIRYIQEEQWSNSSCNYYIYLTRIEFFGTLHQNHKHLFE